MRIFIHRRGLDHGPYTLEKVRKFVSNKKLSLGDLAWSSALGNSNSWLSLEELLSELGKIDPDRFKALNKEIVELPKQLQKIKDLLEKDEAELAVDLACGLGASNELVFSELLKQCCIDEDGTLFLPPWIKSEFREIDHTPFFLNLLAACPAGIDLDASLKIEAVRSLKLVGNEVSLNSLIPFKFLQTLHWEDGNILHLTEFTSFTELQVLELINADELNEIDGLDHILKIQKFNLSGAEKLKSAKVKNCLELEVLDLNLWWNCSLDFLEVEMCPQLETISMEVAQCVKEPKFSELEELKSLDLCFYEGANNILLQNCPLIESISISGEEIEQVNGMQKLENLHTCELRCKSLKRLSLANCNSLENFYLWGSSQLNDIDLSNCSLLSELAEDFSELVNLNLENCLSMEGLDLRYASSLQNLNLRDCSSLLELYLPWNDHSLCTIDLSGCPQICHLGASLNENFNDLKFLSSCPEVTNLTLYLDSKTKNLTFLEHSLKLDSLSLFDLESLNNLEGLESVTDTLSELTLSGLQLKKFPQSIDFPQLTSLHITAERIEEVDFLKCMPNLEVLDLDCESLCSVEGLSHLAELEELEISHFPCHDFSSLQHCTNIAGLSIYRAEELERIDQLPDFSQLETLFLQNCDVLEDLEPLGNSTNLRDLDLNLKSNNNELCFTPLGRLKKLRSLNLQSDQVEHIEWVSFLHNLQELNLYSCINLSKLDGLAKVTNLTFLNLSCCSKIENLDELSSLNKIQEIYLSNCEGLVCIEGLYGLKNLGILDLSDCESINYKQIKEVERMLPECRVRY